MKIRRAPLEFNQVITVKFNCKPTEWFEAAQQFRNQVITNNLYPTGPIMYQVDIGIEEDQTAEFTFHLPVNAEVDFINNDNYSFTKLLRIDDGLVIRHADLDDPLEDSYAMLFACADNQGLKLQGPYYHIYLDVFGDGVIDIYAPIVGREQGDQSA